MPFSIGERLLNTREDVLVVLQLSVLILSSAQQTVFQTCLIAF